MTRQPHAVVDLLPTRVLVPLDGAAGSERAVRIAAAVASALHVPLSLFGWLRNPDQVPSLRAYLERQAAGLEVDAAVEAVEADDVRPASPTLEAAAAVPGTLICMATRARTGIAEALLGSVASEVVRRAPNPTLLVGPEVHGGQPALTGPVIACLDGSALAAQGLPLAAAWAGALDRPLEAVTVARGTQDDVTGARRAAADHGATWQPLAGGPAAQVVAGHAPDDGLLVAATHGHSGLGRIAIGSVALRIVHDAPCPVLVVRPSGLR